MYVCCHTVLLPCIAGMDEADAEEPLTDQQIIAVDHYEVVSTLVRQECSSTEAVRRIGAICTDRALDHRYVSYLSTLCIQWLQLACSICGTHALA